MLGKTHRLIASIAAGLAWLGGFSARAEDFQAVGPVQRWSFDIPDGQYIEDDLKAACPVNAIRGTVHFSRYGKPTTAYPPGFNVLFFSHAKPIERFVRLGFHAPGFRPPFLAELRGGTIEHVLRDQTFNTPVGSDGTLSFVVNWSGEGEVSGSSGGESLSEQLGSPPDAIEFEGFSGAGTVQFELGYDAQPDHYCEPTA